MTIFDRLASYGLKFVGPFRDSAVSAPEKCVCGPADDCQHVQTFRFKGNAGGTPSQVDFVFATSDVGVVSCVALDADEYWGPSDHCPVLTEIEFIGGLE